MKSRLRFILVVALCCISGISFIYAQGTTGAMTGTVTTEGSPLAGATVTANSPAMQGTRVTVTGEGGGFSFPSLPPGQYTVVFELDGMTTITKTTTVGLTQTSRVEADLRVSAVAEAITITASAPAVLESANVGSNFTSELIDDLPVARTIRATVLLAPGVNTGGPGNQISISGAPSYDNVFLVNGVVVNENLRGQPHSLFIEDAIQETSVLTGGGISAEYGRFTGGVVSTLTKSGGNEFTGSFRDSFSNPEWTEKTPFVNAVTGARQADPPDILNEVFEATLGGFVLRDRLWFFLAGRQAEGPPSGVNSPQRFTAVTNLPYNNTVDEKRYEGKLTGQVTSKHSLVASYLDVSLVETNNAFTPIADLDSIVASRELPNSLASLSYHGIFTSNLLVEAQYAEKEFAFIGSGGKLTDRINGTWIQTSIPAVVRYNAPVFCGVCSNELRNNDSWLLKGTYYLTTRSLGNHSVILGVEEFAETRLANNFQSASQFQITTGTSTVVGTTLYPRFDSNTRIIYRPILESSPGTDLATQSLFLNDKWDLNQHLSFNLGVRYDQNDGKDASGNTVSDDSAISPRLGATFDIAGNGRHRINASYARYVAKIADGNVAGGSQAAGNPAYFLYFYGGPAINPAGTPTGSLLDPHQALTQLFAWFDTIGGVANRDLLAGTFIPGFGARFEGPLTSPSVDEITLGYGTQLGATAYARVDGILREWQDFYGRRLNLGTGQITDPFGIRGDVGVIETNNDFIREYEGAQLQFGWRPWKLNIGGNYTWARLTGNDEGEAAGTATSPNTPLALYYPEYLGYERRLPEGYLDGDQRHRATAWVSYDLPTFIGNFNVSLLQRYNSGQAYSAIGSIDASGRSAGTAYVGLPSNPGYTLSQIGTSHSYYFSERGAYRTQDWTATDVALNYALPIWKVQLFLSADMDNIFEEDAVIDLAASRINTTVRTRRSAGAASGLSAFNPFTATPIECPQGAPAATCTSLGANWQLDPNFGRANSADGYQTQRTYRFSAGIKF